MGVRFFNKGQTGVSVTSSTKRFPYPEAALPEPAVDCIGPDDVFSVLICPRCFFRVSRSAFTL